MQDALAERPNTGPSVRTRGFAPQAIADRNEKAAKLLGDQLDKIYGASFTKVIDYEFEGRLKLDLYEALRTNPSEAVSVLRHMFKGDETVSLIFSTLAQRLHGLEAVPESRELLVLIEGLRLVGGSPDP